MGLMRPLTPCRAYLDLGLPRQPRQLSIKLKVHNCTARIAISHLNMHRLIKAHVPIVMDALSLPDDSQSRQLPAETARASGSGTVTTTATFRQSFSKVEVSVEEAAMWLCNDGNHSFGAPDVLQVWCSLQSSSVPSSKPCPPAKARPASLGLISHRLTMIERK